MVKGGTSCFNLDYYIAIITWQSPLRHRQGNRKIPTMLLSVTIYCSVFQTFCCSGIMRNCLRCSWNPMQWSKFLSYFVQWHNTVVANFVPGNVRLFRRNPWLKNTDLTNSMHSSLACLIVIQIYYIKKFQKVLRHTSVPRHTVWEPLD